MVVCLVVLLERVIFVNSNSFVFNIIISEVFSSIIIKDSFKYVFIIIIFVVGFIVLSKKVIINNNFKYVFVIFRDFFKYILFNG